MTQTKRKPVVTVTVVEGKADIEASLATLEQAARAKRENVKKAIEDMRQQLRPYAEEARKILREVEEIAREARPLVDRVLAIPFGTLQVKYRLPEVMVNTLTRRAYDLRDALANVPRRLASIASGNIPDDSPSGCHELGPDDLQERLYEGVPGVVPLGRTVRMPYALARVRAEVASGRNTPKALREALAEVHYLLGELERRIKERSGQPVPVTEIKVDEFEAEDQRPIVVETAAGTDL